MKRSAIRILLNAYVRIFISFNKSTFGINLNISNLRLVSELTLIQSLVGALHGKECLVGAPFDDPAFVDHNNLIGPGNR